MTLIVGILLAIFINREITQLRLRKKTTAMKAKKTRSLAATIGSPESYTPTTISSISR